MAKITVKKREEIRKRLGEIEAELKSLQKQFRNIKKHARGAVEKAIRRRDTHKLEETRKRLRL